MRHSKKETATSYWESQIIDECRYSGLVPGVEGYVTFQHRQNEDLMEEFVEISGVTEFPQVRSTLNIDTQFEFEPSAMYGEIVSGK